MELQFLSGTPILKSSVYSNMSILKDFSVRDHAVLVANLKNSGYVELFKNADANISTGVYKKDNEVVTLCRNSALSEIRVMWEDAQYNATEPMVKPETVGDGETTLSQIGVGAYGHCNDDPMIGMNYIIKNSDGHAIIFDGGVFVENADDIFKALELNGIAKDEDGKFIIAAWIFSHAHGDHIGAFMQFARKYSEETTVKHIMYNFPGEDKISYLHWNSAALEEDIARYPEAKRIVPRMGQIYYFGNAKLTILCSPDMLYSAEKKLTYFNDTSITVMVEAEGVKATFLGDGGDKVAKKIIECFRPKSLKADFVQITHHGLYTSDYTTPYTADEVALMTKTEKAAREAECHVNENLTKFYQYSAPSIGLWPMGDTLGQPRNGRTTVMRDWSRTYGQTAYFVDTDSEDSGYDGVNIVKKGDLITYTMSSEDKLMITKFALKDGKATLLCNQTWESFQEENK